MRKRLAEVYSNFFYFLRDIIQWYLKSRTSRFFGSFNEKVTERFEETAKVITERIDEMDKEAAIGGLAMQRSILHGVSSIYENMDQKMSTLTESVTDVRDELLHLRQQSYRSAQRDFDISDDMVNGLLQSFDQISLTRQSIEYTISKFQYKIYNSSLILLRKKSK
jgi:hypothetical protein